MRYFGTVKSFDETLGHGSISPEQGRHEIGFERGPVMWRRCVDPTPGQRLSYEVRIRDGRTCAVNLRTNLREGRRQEISLRAVQMLLAGVSAVSFATPASAQWGQDRTYSRELESQIDDAVVHGRISTGETVNLRGKLGKLVQLERDFMPNGISGAEYAILFRRSAALATEIRVAGINPSLRDDNPALTWVSGNSNGHWVPDARFAGLHPGDRFSGDARIGQHVTPRIVSMPVKYRSDYVDTDQIYYGFDDGRVYQIDRKTQLILGLLDLDIVP
jgi:cold shock CspA family protein